MMFSKIDVPTNVVAEKNLYDGTGKLQSLKVPKNTKGRVIDGWAWGLHKYILVKFDNGVRWEFGDARHPLISWKGCVKFVE